jgi:hypothetical protein
MVIGTPVSTVAVSQSLVAIHLIATSSISAQRMIGSEKSALFAIMH